MIIVCYLYNNNGMGSWCIEAAKALHYSGQEVILIKSADIYLPEDFPVKFLTFAADESVFKHRSLYKKVFNKISKNLQLLPFVKWNDNFLLKLNQHLTDRSIYAKCYLLNQTSFVNKKLNVPQYVVAWSYKPFLKDYLKKAILLSENFNNLKANLFNAIYWHKIDWLGYKHATGVLAVSNGLTNLLLNHHIPANTVYPGASYSPTDIKTSRPKVVSLAMMALSLNDKRKGLELIINKLKKIKPYDFQLTLIGECSEAFKQGVLTDDFPAMFTGLLS